MISLSTGRSVWAVALSIIWFDKDPENATGPLFPTRKNSIAMWMYAAFSVKEKNWTAIRIG